MTTIQPPPQEAPDRILERFFRLRYALIVIFTFSSAGCTGPGRLAKIVTALKDDPATVTASISSVYGVLKFTRTNPRTNQTITVHPDGTITIGAVPPPAAITVTLPGSITNPPLR